MEKATVLVELVEELDKQRRQFEMRQPAFQETHTVGADDYLYDVFISHPHDFSGEWVRYAFMPLFQRHLAGALERAPEVFIDQQEISPGESWPLRLRVSLAHSRILVPFWSPSYLRSEWCRREYSVMRQREKQLGHYTTQRKPGGLIAPILIAGGTRLPLYPRQIPHLDLRDYFFQAVKVFLQSPKYLELEAQIRDWVQRLAQVIEWVPEWRAEWLDNLGEEEPALIQPFSYPPPAL
ncbi:MAG: toll/interleukin-1 receptor domain-containing protein [Chloroflexota bacterium]